MVKRPSQGADAGGKARKRLKVVHEAPTHEAITTTRQLKGLLAFDQDLKKARHGMLGFYDKKSAIAKWYRFTIVQGLP
jgi:nucleolar pre-ribosomal-associated protein 1